MTRDFTKGARTSFYAMLLAMGTLFWIFSITGHFTMSEDVYGPDVLALPSELWAGGMMFPAWLYLVALYINGRRWWTPYIRLSCGFFVCFYFSLFVVSAWPASGGDLMVIASATMTLKAGVFAWIDGAELMNQRGRDGAE